MVRVLIQRVTRGAVSVDGKELGRIDQGLVLLVGVGQGDGPEQVRRLSKKIVHLRIFADESGRMNRSLLDVDGGALVISQFTLYADTRKGRRPSYIHAADPAVAAPLVDALAAALRDLGVRHVPTGRFGAMMSVLIENDGPVTIWLEDD